MTNHTIGHIREDGDLDVLVCLNNDGGRLTQEEFDGLKIVIMDWLNRTEEAGGVRIFDRQDCPSVVSLD